MEQKMNNKNKEESQMVSCDTQIVSAETIMEEINKKLPMIKTLEALTAVHEMIVICLDNEQKRNQSI